MKQEIFTCDRCGYETTSWDRHRPDPGEGTSRQMHSVGVVVTDSRSLDYNRYSVSGGGVPPAQAADWCENCVRELRLAGPPPRPDEAPSPPTLEEIIREIVRKEVSAGG